MNGATRVGVMITTKNRIDDLRRTLDVVKALEPAADEIIVTADGCDDGTPSYVLECHPAVRLIVNDIGRGSVASRDTMLRESTCDIVLSLDDDSYPVQRDCIARIRREFEARPHAALIHFPQRTDEYPESLTQTDFGAPHQTRSFANAGAAFRREVYLALPGFYAGFFHMYEEPDYALQCVAAGHEVVLVPDIVVRHHYSPANRGSLKSHHQHARNECWSTVLRCPAVLTGPLVCYRVYSQARFIFSRQGLRGLVNEPKWWWAALRGLPRVIAERRPVALAGYRRWLRLP